LTEPFFENPLVTPPILSFAGKMNADGLQTQYLALSENFTALGDHKFNSTFSSDAVL